MEDAKEQRQDIKQSLDKYEEDIQKVKNDLNKLFDRKNEVREEFFKAKLEYEIQKDEISHAEWIKRQKEQLVEREKEKAERIAARKQAMLDRPNPYLKEIETCEHLIGYCNKLKVLTGMVQVPVDEQIKEEQKQIMNQLNREDVNKKLQDGKLERVLSKREREEQEMLKVGGKNKGKGPRKVKASEVEEAFKIDILAINKFGFLKVSPPLNKESLDSKIQELTEKLAKYKTDGEQRLKDEEEKLLNSTEPVEEEEEEKASTRRDEDDDGSYRRGRGGFRGGRGGRGGFRPTTEGGRRGGRQQREEETYQDDEDEGYAYTEIVHTKQNRRANRKEDLNNDDKNYPTLN